MTNNAVSMSKNNQTVLKFQDGHEFDLRLAGQIGEVSNEPKHGDNGAIFTPGQRRASAEKSFFAKQTHFSVTP